MNAMERYYYGQAVNCSHSDIHLIRLIPLLQMSYLNRPRSYLFPFYLIELYSSNVTHLKKKIIKNIKKII